MVVIDVESAESAMVGLVDRYRPDAKLPVQMALDEFKGQGLANNFVFRLLL